MGTTLHKTILLHTQIPLHTRIVLCTRIPLHNQNFTIHYWNYVTLPENHDIAELCYVTSFALHYHDSIFLHYWNYITKMMLHKKNVTLLELNYIARLTFCNGILSPELHYWKYKLLYWNFTILSEFCYVMLSESHYWNLITLNNQNSMTLPELHYWNYVTSHYKYCFTLMEFHYVMLQ